MRRTKSSMLNVTQRLWLPNSNIDTRWNLNFLITFTRKSTFYLHKYTHAMEPFYQSRQLIQTAAAGATLETSENSKIQGNLPILQPNLAKPQSIHILWKIRNCGGKVSVSTSVNIAKKATSVTRHYAKSQSCDKCLLPILKSLSKVQKHLQKMPECQSKSPMVSATHKGYQDNRHDWICRHR